MKHNICPRTLLLALASAALSISAARGQGGYDTPKKTDTFDAGPEVTHPKAKGRSTARAGAPQPPARGPNARLKRGQIVQVLQSSKLAHPEMAFYLPREATSVVQVVVEQKGSQVNYFLKALSSGKTVGGAVERQWLDAQGFRPRNLADEARIQAAVQRNPLFIEVQ